MNREIPVQSVRKALDLLNILVFEDPAREGLALGNLAGRLGFPAATAHNLLKTLCACGYAAQAGVGRYTIGPRCRDIGRYNSLLSEPVSSAIRKRMEALGRLLGETVTFAALADGRRLLLWSANAHQLIRVDSADLESRKLFSLPTGRILAAYAEPGELLRLLERYGLPARQEWPKTTTRTALDAALSAIRARGHEVIIRDDVTAFAVPVLDGQGRLVGSLGCFAPSFRCPAEKHEPFVAELKQAAHEMTQT
jgi:DNA-binding IclR family transcriptional regulator